MIRPHDLRLVSASGLALTLASGLVASAQNPRNDHHVGPETFTSRVVAGDLENPWEVAWGPDDFLWVTERTAMRVTRLNPSDGSRQAALTLEDGYQSVVQDGLLGMALHPDLLRGRGRDYVYLAYTYDKDPGAGVTRRLRVRRYTYDPARRTLGSPIDLLDDLPAHDDHGAGRLAIGPDGKLYLTRGDLGSNWLANYCNAIHAQDLPAAAAVRARDWSSYQGKILRLNPDGSIPDDNPVLGGVRSHIYAYGFRNPQGMAFAPDGRLYVSDHGPSTDDEIDLVLPGKNYGWPRVAGFKDDRSYDYANWSASAPTPCRELKFNSLEPPASVPRARESAWHDPDFIPPLATLFSVPAGYDLAKSGNSTVAPAGIDIYDARAIPGWSRSILLAAMSAGVVYRLHLAPDGTRIEGSPVEYFKTTNRYRDIVVSPDGRRIYLTTDSFGTTADEAGRRTSRLTNPGAMLEFTYTGSSSRGAR
jgi:PQQ-dependent dehydrogenase (s-GDH family)